MAVACRVTIRSSTPGLTECSQLDILGLRYKSVQIGEPKQIETKLGRVCGALYVSRAEASWYAGNALYYDI